jgi:hypothetical protein
MALNAAPSIASSDRLSARRSYSSISFDVYELTWNDSGLEVPPSSVDRGLDSMGSWIVRIIDRMDERMP